MSYCISVYTCDVTRRVACLYCTVYILYTSEGMRILGADMERPCFGPPQHSRMFALLIVSLKKKKKYLTTYSFAILLRHFNNLPVTRQQEKRLQSRLYQLEDFYGGFFGIFLRYLFNTDLSATTQVPLCRRGYCDRNQNCCNFLIGSQTF
jgi:hypothetical protein